MRLSSMSKLACTFCTSSWSSRFSSSRISERATFSSVTSTVFYGTMDREASENARSLFSNRSTTSLKVSGAVTI